MDEGTWPTSWPKELEPYREQASSFGVAHGIQEEVYEIPFDNREEFEKAWPHILKVKDKGAPLILDRSPSTYDVSGFTMTTGVRILASPCAVAAPPGGTKLNTGPPWPDYLTESSGVLPEYVVAQDGKWVPFPEADRKGFRYRARVDIMLVCDGKVVDLNRIPLPADTPIIDRRFAVD
jgi:hypothetical protein